MPSSNYLRGKIVDLVLRNVAYTPPATVYLSLHTSDPTPAALTGTEVSGAWYGRQTATFAAQTTAGQTSNSNTITYNGVTGSSVTVTNFALWDAATLGNMLESGSLSASKTYNISDVPCLLPGQLAITLT